MRVVRNVLFVMADQWRADYLGCEGHPTLHTPNLDALAARGVRFNRAYAQGTICGSSRMSFYTGRYVSSHGAFFNNVPLRIDESTLGEHLRRAGVRAAVVGKTHSVVDSEALMRCGIDPTSSFAVHLANAGFEPFERDDGLFPVGRFGHLNSAYAQYLRARGYASDNPWFDFANAVTDEDGRILPGSDLRSARYAARIDEADSETAYMTRRAMSFVDDAGERPWFLHLSYIKPHWPLVVPVPFHGMYSASDVLPAKVGDESRAIHPVHRAFMERHTSMLFADPAVRGPAAAAYMALMTQVDDHIGQLLAHLDRRDRLKDTMIVFTSDHGDYLGDHRLAEKELFHEPSVRIPLIVASPSPEAEATRGTSCDALIESIDLMPTFSEALGASLPSQAAEGRSLLPWLHGERPARWRTEVRAEHDYSPWRDVRTRLQRPLDGCRCVMLRNERYKFIHYDGFEPQLFDLSEDPEEMHDRVPDGHDGDLLTHFYSRLIECNLRLRYHPTVDDRWVETTQDRYRAAGLEP